MTERIPLFPLGTVLYPGLLLPLHVFEERYRQLVRDLTALPEETPRRFGVILIRQGREVGPHGISALHEVGCLAVLHHVQPYDDGRFDLVCVGSSRFRVHGLDTSRAYLQGDVDLLDEPGGAEAEVLAVGVAERFAAYRSLLAPGEQASGNEARDQAGGQADRRSLAGDPTALSYLVAAATILDRTDKQRLLAAPDTGTRLGFELQLLRRELAIVPRLRSLPAVDLPHAAYSRS